MTVLGNNHLNESPQSTQISQAEASATGTKIIRHLWRPALDAGLALLLFMIATLTLASAPSSASPGVNLGLVQFAKPSSEPIQTQLFQPANLSSPIIKVDIKTGHLSQQAEWLLLGLAFSLLVAMNLAFFRHLRHAYADPRKRSESNG